MITKITESQIDIYSKQIRLWLSLGDHAFLYIKGEFYFSNIILKLNLYQGLNLEKSQYHNDSNC